ncbi:heparinase II/III family protein [Elizabethkingia meningoseptica]|uniref:heparinase II/III domain-containing protein n=1 Tax=Elizabethkingia meningoseptica TaxID=238 RepID=UPI0038911FB6
MKYFTLLVFTLLVSVCNVKAQQTFDVIAGTPHPRLFLQKNEESALINAITKNKDLKTVDQTLKTVGDSIIKLPNLTHKKIGIRLLSVSREALRRIFTLSYLYRTTKDEKYFKAAEKELLQVSSFADWNPSHFLDVAEMTLAVAIGYDWLYDKLSDSSREKIKNAIIENGLKPSLDSKQSHWLKFENNWNQVCNTGISAGAMAVYEDQPAMASQIISRAIESIKIPMKRYKPDGTYPEGYAYWNYGTTYNVIFLDLLEKLTKSDHQLSQAPGFMKTAEYFQHLIGSSGLAFNYSDGGSKPETSGAATFWFAGKLHNPSLAWNDIQYIRDPSKKSLFYADRFLPLIPIWGKDLAGTDIHKPEKLFWSGDGENPVAMMRTDWTNPNALFLGFKLGSPSVEHAHMDVGSFVFDADGVRWSMDFGAQDYESLESKNINLWTYGQNAQRWTVFRYNNFAHSTLAFNDDLQYAKGRATLLKTSDHKEFSFATSDLTDVYKDKVAKIIRGVALKNQAYGMIQDEIQTGSNPARIRWSMVTPSTVEIVSPQEVILKQGNKKLLLKVNSKSPFTLKTWGTDPKTSYDAPNPGTTIVGFEAELPANSKSTFNVQLIPGGKMKKRFEENVQPIENWK